MRFDLTFCMVSGGSKSVRGPSKQSILPKREWFKWRFWRIRQWQQNIVSTSRSFLKTTQSSKNNTFWATSGSGVLAQDHQKTDPRGWGPILDHFWVAVRCLHFQFISKWPKTYYSSRTGRIGAFVNGRELNVFSWFSEPSQSSRNKSIFIFGRLVDITKSS